MSTPVIISLTMLTPSDHARHARAELEAIAAALRVHELAQLVALARRLAEHSDGLSEGPRESQPQ